MKLKTSDQLHKTSFIKHSFLDQIQLAFLTALQFATTERLQHIAGSRKESNLDSFRHFCQHCNPGAQRNQMGHFSCLLQLILASR